MRDPERHTYRVMRSLEDQEDVGTVAEMPSLSWLEPTEEAALAGIQQLVSEVIEDNYKKRQTSSLICLNSSWL